MFLLLLIPTFAAETPSHLKDEFEGIQCGMNIAKKLQGRTSLNRKVMETEQQYKNLRLKDVGGEMLTERLNLVTWKICDQLYVVLYDKNRIKDVLPLPEISEKQDPVVRECKIKEQTISNVLPIIKTHKDGTTEILNAWVIDTDKMKFLPQTTQDLICDLGP